MLNIIYTFINIIIIYSISIIKNIKSINFTIHIFIIILLLKIRKLENILFSLIFWNHISNRWFISLFIYLLRDHHLLKRLFLLLIFLFLIVSSRDTLDFLLEYWNLCVSIWTEERLSTQRSFKTFFKTFLKNIYFIQCLN